MRISERIFLTIEQWRTAWGDALKEFSANFLGWGIEIFFNILGKAAAPKLKPLIDTIEKNSEIPPELKPIFDELKEPTGQVAALFAQSAGGALVGGAIGKLLDFIFRPVMLGFSYVPGFMILDPPQLLSLWRRGFITEDYLSMHLHWLGFGDDDIAQLKNLTEIRLDPATIITAWRRDPELYEKYLNDLKQQGWSDDRIETLKFATQAFPSLADVITFYAKEAFEPDMIERYGLKDEMPPYEGTLFEKLGVPKEISELYWLAHWEHASWTQVTEMLHRGQLTEEEVYEWYRVVEIPPYWRDKLTAISWRVPTRVDVRRFWDMRVISEERLREIYEHLGYHGKDLEDYILWTKVYTDFPMMMARFTKGWITQDEVYDWLVAQGVPEERAQHFIEEKIKPEQPERVVKERDLTKSEIVKAVKKEYITSSEGMEMLMDLGYDRFEAEFKLAIDVGVLEGSPETYMEFKRLTQLYKQAQGLPFQMPSPDLIHAEKDYKETEKALAIAIAEKATAKQIAELKQAVEDTKIRYHQLLAEYQKEG